MDSLLKLCDYLNLHLLVLNSDIRFQFKFNELRNKRAMEYLDNGQGKIDLEKFFKWWFCSPDELKAFN
jgi:hypothetical protein